MSKILLADDHPMIRTALEVLLRETRHEIVGMASSGQEALAKVEQLTPDVLLLDLQMPSMGGMEVLRRIRAEGRTTRVVLLTAAINDSALIEARALKVRGIVLKNSDPAYLLDCLDRVERGQFWTDPELQQRLTQLDRNSAHSTQPQLTARERELIGFVRRGMRNREIAGELKVTEGTVKAYLHKLFDKLGVASRTELAIKAEEFLRSG